MKKNKNALQRGSSHIKVVTASVIAFAIAILLGADIISWLQNGGKLVTFVAFGIEVTAVKHVDSGTVPNQEAKVKFSSDADKQELDADRKKAAKELGLPDITTWNEIISLDSELHRIEVAKKMGLPVNATWDVITHADSEIHRKQVAAEMGLPVSATWDDITHTDSEIHRKQVAKAMGLPETATWDDIIREYSKKSQK